MTPTIITADGLARAAASYEPAGSGTELRLATMSPRFRREAAAAGSDLFTRDIRSHLPEETPVQATWRWDRARYAGVGRTRRPSRADGSPTRAAGRPAGRRRSESAEASPDSPALSLTYTIRAREGVRVGVTDHSAARADLNRAIDRARYHLARSRDLVAAAGRPGLTDEEREARVERATEHLRRAEEIRDRVAAHLESLSPQLRERAERFTGHAAFARIAESVAHASVRYVTPDWE